jgi:hypothetical protein
MKRQFREISDQTKQKLSAKKSGVNNPMYGKKHTEQTKRLISQALTRYWENVPSKNNTLKIN